MTNKKSVKEVSNKKMKIVLGIFLMLLMIVFSINSTAIPRIFTFAFSYLFGLMSYLLYIVIWVIGLLLVFRNKKVKISSWSIVVGSAVLLLASILLVGFISVANSNHIALNLGTSKYIVSFKNDSLHVDYLKAYNSIFNSFESGKNYITQDTINFFDPKYPVGSGLVGYLLLASGNTLFNNAFGGLVLAIILFIVAAMIYSSPFILRAIKSSKSNNKKEKRVKKSNKQKSVQPNYTIFSTNDEDLIKEPIIKTETIFEEPVYSQENENSFIDTDAFVDDIQNGSFVKPVFVLDDSIGSIASNSDINAKQNDYREPEVVIESVSNVPVEDFLEDPFEQFKVEEPLEKEVRYEEISLTPEVTPIVINEPRDGRASASNVETPIIKQEIKLEPISNKKEPEIDMSLALAKPEFIEPETKKEETPAAPVRRPRVDWVPPSSDLLDVVETSAQAERNMATAAARKQIIEKVFEDFKIGAYVESYTVGPSVTRFNIGYEPNATAKQVEQRVTEISIRLGGILTRFVPVVEGQITSGLEIPNAAITMVTFKEVFEALPDVKKHPLSVAFGKNISGDVIYADFNDFPHLLSAGTTGSGKSIFINSLIATLIMRNSPDDLKLILVDPKKVEMTRYQDMPHLLRPILYSAQETKLMADKLVEEMERRYQLFASSNGATNLKEYNEDCEINGNEKLPYIVFIFDEYADLIDQCKELSAPVVSLAQKARACGIHLMITTQRPSTNVVTGTIKANLPTHVALMTSNSVDSQTIIGEGGAEKLLGKGDMLVQSPLVSRVGAVRLQGCFASRGEIGRVVNDLKSRYETYYDPKYLNLEEEAKAEGDKLVNSPEFKNQAANSEEEKFNQIKEWVMGCEYMSLSKIQRDCAVGFNRAGRFFNRLVEMGIVDDHPEGNKGCRVLVSNKFSDEDLDVATDEQSYFREDD